MDKITLIFFSVNMIALIVNLIVLSIAIYQSILSRRSLIAAVQTIRNEKIIRQLEVLPKSGWIIHVDVILMSWQEDLQKKSSELKKAAIEKNEDILKRLSTSTINQPYDLNIDEFTYEEVPPWLKNILISGAQYYFDAVGVAHSLWSDNEGANFGLARTTVNLNRELG